MSAEEIFKAENYLIKYIQEESVSEVIQSLKESKKIPKGSQLLQLNPIVTDEGLVVVKGRWGIPTCIIQ